jgi:hydroxyethylthiazole kinase-like uncharacterized protein yjeF
VSQINAQIRKYLPAPASTDNKYSRGVVGLVTGSALYPGAALLGVETAQAVGVGMVRYFGPSAVISLLLTAHPEIICAQQLENGSNRTNAWALGSGVPASDVQQMANIEAALAQGAPCVLDAAAIHTVNVSSLKPDLVILTPHDGEMKLLLEQLGMSPRETEEGLGSIDGRIALAQLAQKLTNQVILLKGNQTVIAAGGGRVAVVGPNSPYLATAGSGDVLTAILGALAARNLSVDWFELATFAVQLHSAAAENARQNAPVTAGEISRSLWQIVTKALAA